jgi:hypothetical protein
MCVYKRRLKRTLSLAYDRARAHTVDYYYTWYKGAPRWWIGESIIILLLFLFTTLIRAYIHVAFLMTTVTLGPHGVIFLISVAGVAAPVRCWWVFAVAIAPDRFTVTPIWQHPWLVTVACLVAPSRWNPWLVTVACTTKCLHAPPLALAVTGITSLCIGHAVVHIGAGRTIARDHIAYLVVGIFAGIWFWTLDCHFSQLLGDCI